MSPKPYLVSLAEWFPAMVAFLVRCINSRRDGRTFRCCRCYYCCPLTSPVGQFSYSRALETTTFTRLSQQRSVGVEQTIPPSTKTTTTMNDKTLLHQTTIRLHTWHLATTQRTSNHSNASNPQKREQ